MLCVLGTVDSLSADTAYGLGRRFVVVTGANGLHWVHSFVLSNNSGNNSSNENELPPLAEDAGVSVHLQFVQWREPDDSVLAGCFIHEQQKHQEQQHSVMAVVTAAFSLERIIFPPVGEAGASLQRPKGPTAAFKPIKPFKVPPKRALRALLLQDKQLHETEVRAAAPWRAAAAAFVRFAALAAAAAPFRPPAPVGLAACMLF